VRVRGCGGEAAGAEPQLVHELAEPGGGAVRLLRHSSTSRAGPRLAEREEAICPIGRPLFPFSSLSLSFPLHLSLVNETRVKDQRTPNAQTPKRSKRSDAQTITRSPRGKD
jgi:hypothetical protein